jgi:2-phospho-L-lactate guanylyltransferase
MRTIAILPVKSFGAAKQRLSAALAGGARQALAQAMFSDVLSALRHVDGLEAIAVVTGDRTAEAAALGERVMVLRDTEQSGQSPAAATGVQYALASGFERVLLVPGDTPLLDAGELSALLARGEAERLGLVVVPDRHGSGTNALLLHPPDAIEPSFGPNSCERHMNSAREAGVSCSLDPLPSMLLDVDTAEDLEELGKRLGESRGHAPQTRGALSQLDRSQASVSA